MQVMLAQPGADGTLFAQGDMQHHESQAMLFGDFLTAMGLALSDVRHDPSSTCSSRSAPSSAEWLDSHPAARAYYLAQVSLDFSPSMQ